MRDSYLARTVRRIPILRDRGKGFPPEWVRERILAPVGFSTLDDGSVVLGMDAPAGVGAAMRDRLGLKVYPNGAATISLINNKTGIPVRLISEDNGEGGIEFLDYDLQAPKAFIKRIGYKGETKTEQSLGGN